MRILLHPEIDPLVARAITRHDVRTAADEGCAELGIEELLAVAAGRGFEVIVGVAPPEGVSDRMTVPAALRLILLSASSGAARDILPEVSKFLPVIEEMPQGRPVVFSSTNIMRCYVGDEFVEEKVLPTPDVVMEGTLERVDQEVARLFASTASFVHFMAFTADGQRGIGVAREYGVLNMDENVRWKERPDHYIAVLRFFEERGLPMIENYLADEGDTRVLGFRLPDDEQAVARICREALLQLHAVGEDEPLLFNLEVLRP